MSATLPANQSRIQKQKVMMIEQLKKNPIIQIACERLEIGRATHYRWCKEDSDYARSIDEAIMEGINLCNDLSESQILSAIQSGDINAAKFFLRANHARYKNKVEFSGTLRHSDEPMTPEQEELLKEALRMALPSNQQTND